MTTENFNNEKIAHLLALGEQRRAQARIDALEKLSPREQRLVSEALVAGYVASSMANGDRDIPKDKVIVAIGLDVVLGYPDLYPLLADYQPETD